MEYIVLAQSFKRETGEPVGFSREEKINTETNNIFKKCKSILEIKEQYEAFWNDLNTNSNEIVFVQQIRKV